MISKESNINLVVTGLLLGILMAAMDNTIVATAMGMTSQILAFLYGGTFIILLFLFPSLFKPYTVDPLQMQD